MSSICPTVTATDVETFHKQLRLVSSFAQRIHIDLMDGKFAPTTSPSLKDVIVQAPCVVDVHIMYKNPFTALDDVIAIKPNVVIIHAECDADIPLFAARLREKGIKTGLALLPETEISAVTDLLPHVQHVLIFGGHLGYHGGEADMTQLHKVHDIQTFNRFLEIGWDGGANANNIQQLTKAGIDVINVGGGIHKTPDPAKTYATLTAIVS